MKQINRVEKETACKLAKTYCVENGIDYNQLISLRYIHTASIKGAEGTFCLEPKIKYIDGAGLTMDIETQFRPVLTVYEDGSIETYPLIEELRIKK